MVCLDGISFSQCVRDRNGKLLRVTLSADQKFRIWTPLNDISPDLIDATLRYEDKYYTHHPGVNPLALARCALDLLRFHRVTAGGSTITMQLVRLRFHLHTRTISGKLEQIMRALELERHYSKNEILEAYLNLAPYGRNIEGIGAASQIYFDKPASKLSRPEAVALSVIPQSPSRRALFSDRDNHSINVAQSNWYDRSRSDSETELSMREFRPRMRLLGSGVWRRGIGNKILRHGTDLESLAYWEHMYTYRQERTKKRGQVKKVVHGLLAVQGESAAQVTTRLRLAVAALFFLPRRGMD